MIYLNLVAKTCSICLVYIVVLVQRKSKSLLKVFVYRVTGQPAEELLNGILKCAIDSYNICCFYSVVLVY
jgi:hypothetical protein